MSTQITNSDVEELHRNIQEATTIAGNNVQLIPNLEEIHRYASEVSTPDRTANFLNLLNQIRGFRSPVQDRSAQLVLQIRDIFSLYPHPFQPRTILNQINYLGPSTARDGMELLRDLNLRDSKVDSFKEELNKWYDEVKDKEGKAKSKKTEKEKDADEARKAYKAAGEYAEQLEDMAEKKGGVLFKVVGFVTGALMLVDGGVSATTFAALSALAGKMADDALKKYSKSELKDLAKDFRREETKAQDLVTTFTKEFDAATSDFDKYSDQRKMLSTFQTRLLNSSAKIVPSMTLIWAFHSVLRNFVTEHRNDEQTQLRPHIQLMNTWASTIVSDCERFAETY